MALSMAAAQEAAKTADSSADAKKKVIDPAARTVEVKFSDEGQLRMVLETDKLEVDSPYGKLSIPVEEIRYIEFATRLSEKVGQQIEKGVFDLGSPDFDLREAATKQLLDLKEKAYPALLRATKHPDLEVAQRAKELAAKVRESLPAEKLVVREWDVIETTHSVVSGKITGGTMLVNTSQFGKQQLQLTDVRSLRSLLVEEVSDEPIEAMDDPGNLSSYSGAIGKTLAFRVTGRADGSIWGTGIYTTDSNLATAAVHTGVLKVGEAGVVRVTIIASPPAFASSMQNGITSYPYGSYPSAYQLHVKAAAPEVGLRRGRGRGRAGGFGGGGFQGGGAAEPGGGSTVPPGGGFVPARGGRAGGRGAFPGGGDIEFEGGLRRAIAPPPPMPPAAAVDPFAPM
jgi:hypothetical protein